MKMMGQVKEANRFLRGIDFDEATDSLKKIEVDSNSFLKLILHNSIENNYLQRETTKHLITNDINYICSRLNKGGQQDISQIFSKVRNTCLMTSIDLH